MNNEELLSIAIESAKKAGVDNYIIKPFNAETLETKIKTTLAKCAQR